MKKMLLILFLLFCLNYPNGLTTSAKETGKIKEYTEILKTIKYNKIINNILFQLEEKDSITYLNRNSIPIYSPIEPVNIQKISSDYGWRNHPILHIKIFHHGIDMAASLGTFVKSTADGVIIKTQKSKYGYGNEIIIKHFNGYETRYAHLDSLNVTVGQKVKLHTIIGKVGVTGLTTGPHLHYEILKNGKNIDPLFFTYTDKKERSLANYTSVLITLK